MQAVANCPQKANSWSCSFQHWRSRSLGCDCLSNSYRLWRRVVKTHTFVGIQHPPATVNGCDLTPPTRTQTSELPVAGVRKHRTLTTFPRLSAQRIANANKIRLRSKARNSQNRDDTLSTKVWHLCPPGPPTLFGRTSFSARSCRPCWFFQK